MLAKHSLCLERERFSQRSYCSVDKEALPRNSTDLMVSTVFLMFTPLHYTPSSLEKAPYLPTVLLVAPHRDCSTQGSQAACPGMWTGSVFTKTVLLGLEELINAQDQQPRGALLQLLYLGRNESCI